MNRGGHHLLDERSLAAWTLPLTARPQPALQVFYGGVEERTRKAKRGTTAPVWNHSVKLCVPSSPPLRFAQAEICALHRLVQRSS